MPACCSFINALPGSLYEFVTSSFTGAGSSVELFGANPRRCGITLHSSSSAITDLGFDSSVTTDTGFFSMDVRGGQVWSWDNEGPLIQRPWFAYSSGAGDLVVTQTMIVN